MIICLMLFRPGAIEYMLMVAVLWHEHLIKGKPIPQVLLHGDDVFRRHQEIRLF